MDISRLDSESKISEDAIKENNKELSTSYSNLHKTSKKGMETYLKSNQMPVTVDEVYEDMLDKIINLEIEPGRKISENEKCAEYNISRSTIRTVFTRLKSQKLIEIYPQRGTYVSLIDINYVKDILYLRTALEKDVLSEVMKLPNKESLVKALAHNIEQQKQYYNCKNYSTEYKILDEEFHNLLISSVKRSGLLKLMKEQLIHVSRWRNFEVNYTQRLSELIDEHYAILNAIKTNDLQKAQDCITVHLQSITKMSSESTEIYPQYFKF